MKKPRIWLPVMIGVFVLALVWLIFRLALAANVDTDPVILPTPQVTGDGPGQPSTDGGGSSVLVTPDTVQAVIAELDRIDSYSRTISVESFWTGGSSKQEISVWVRGSSTKLVIVSGSIVKNVLIEADDLWIWYSGSDAVYSGSAGESTADEYQTLLTYEQVLELDKSRISDAGYTEYNNESCIYVRYSSGELGYESLCYISVYTGLLMGCETYDGQQLIYSMQSSQPDISTPDGSIFAHP